MAVDEILETEEEKQTLYCWFDIRDREYTEARLRISERCQDLERKLSSHRSNSVKSSQSHSRYSSKSERSFKTSSSHASSHSRSSTRSLKVEAAAKTARLKAEMEYLDAETEARHHGESQLLPRRNAR